MRNEPKPVNRVEIIEVILTGTTIFDADYPDGVYVQQWWTMHGEHIATHDPREMKEPEE